MNTSVNSYPMLVLDKVKLLNNIKKVTDKCAEAGIEVAGVVKGFNGIPEAVRAYAETRCAQIATSRIDQIAEAREAGIAAEYMLIRIPMKSEAANVIKFADYSLNSEPAVIDALEVECLRQGKTHGVVLMADLGDLREGFWDKEELLAEALRIEKQMKGVKLAGVGTNLGCYGSIKPTAEKMNELCEIAETIEEQIGRKLEIVSGGATSSYPLVLSGEMPKGVNHLRIGEGVILAYDLKDLWGLDMRGLYQDVFTFCAEVIEVKDKPTHPVGEIFIDGFGRKPEYEDRGIRRRAIIAAGKLDYALNDKIFPRTGGVEVIGSSSDHTILDVQDSERDWKIGDIMEFDVSYPSLIYLTNSRYVTICIKE